MPSAATKRARTAAGRCLVALWTLAVLCAAPPSPAAAQGLRSLHVDALAMRVDRARLRVGDVFHLAIHAHVREKITALDELVIPDIGTMQNEGDERHVTHSPGGTDVVETLTLEPTTPGPFTFAGAYLDAIDARDGKPSRFRANAVHVVVDPPGPLAALAGPGTALLLALLATAAAAAVAALGLIVLVRRRRRTAPAPVEVSWPASFPVPTPRTPRTEVADALRAYRAAPQTASLVRLRAALFAASGAAPGTTLRDALGATEDRGLRTALLAAERAAFGPATIRDASSTELVDAVEGWLR